MGDNGSPTLEKDLASKLVKRREDGLLRELRHVSDKADFCSNDYLGFARSDRMRALIEESLRSYRGKMGATGARLISGDSPLFDALEAEVSAFHGAEAALIFNSGYDANLGLFSSIAAREDTILYDELSHASIRDGVRLSFAKSHSFRHNDLADLKQKMESARGRIIISVESVYSMDGDFAPLEDLVDLSDAAGASLIVDEAHATGVFGEAGKGRVHELGFQSKVFARLHTFGKALGTHGAAILGSPVLREYLINHARSFIYTTALPTHSLLAIRAAYRMLGEDRASLRALHDRIGLMLLELGHAKNRIASASPIQAFLFPGIDNARRVALDLQRSGLDVRPILAPTVPAGSERLRVCIHSFNTEDEIRRLCEKLKPYCEF